VTLAPDVDAAFFRAFAEAVDPAPKQRRWATPGAMAKELDSTTVQTPALELIDQALVDLADGAGQQRLAIFLAPQEGKSERASHWFPLWLLMHNPDLRIAIVSHEAELARGWGAAIKRDVEMFNGDEGCVDLGLRLRADSKAVGRWSIEGHRGGVYAVGISGSLTGRPVDLLVLDDPISNLEQAQSIKYRDRAHRFWQGVAVPRMGPQTKTILIQTRWHEDDLAGRLLATEGDRSKGGKWRVVSIPAQCEDEATDPLGRREGEYMVSTRGRTRQDWEERKADLGAYVWAALCQQRPSPAEGGLFRRIWWRYFTLEGTRLHVGGRTFDTRDLWKFATVDLAASTRTSADFTVIAAWARTLDGDLVLLDMVRAKIGEEQHFAHALPLVQRWNLDTVFVEASQYGTTLVRQATQEGVPITPIQAEVDKFSRALPYSAWTASGRVWLPAGALWLDTWIGEHASFPASSHDDMVDVGSMAIRVAVTKKAPQPAAFPVPAKHSPEETAIGGSTVDFLSADL
jgi:predicted phage terminase large subunit-like protein